MIYDENAFEDERDGANRGTPARSPKRKERTKVMGKDKGNG